MSFLQFESLLAEVGRVFSDMKEKFPEEIRCKPGCDDCCNAFFDVSLIEAEYIRLGLSRLTPENLSFVKERAEIARKITEELKKELHAQSELSESHLVGHWRVPCPMLSKERQCLVYEHRPVTCRAYGLPTSIGEKGHVCGFSAFDKGKTYPTIKLDQINAYLKDLSEAHAVGGKIPTGAVQKRMFLYEIILLNS